jgi:hypothetical protein
VRPSSAAPCFPADLARPIVLSLPADRVALAPPACPLTHRAEFAEYSIEPAPEPLKLRVLPEEPRIPATYWLGGAGMPSQTAYYSWKVRECAFCNAARLTARQEYAQAKKVRAHGDRRAAGG